MPKALSVKLALALKVLSTTRGRLAAELGVDKSLVGKWVSGAVTPSAHNLARLSALIAVRVEGFTSLDWDRELADLATVLGARTLPSEPVEPGPAMGLLLPLMDDILAGTRVRGAAYEGFFRSTRPLANEPGRFIHDHGMIRLEAGGLLRLRMGTWGVFVDGWLAPLHNKLFCVATELSSHSPVFGVFNGMGGIKAHTLDGLLLTAILDAGRTPTASAIVFSRIGDLTGDEGADDRRFAELVALDPLAAEGSVPEALRAHLVRDIGPAQLALGGDWLLRMPVERSWSA
jgi:transcriptional regulator with XRE-family HTH domain